MTVKTIVYCRRLASDRSSISPEQTTVAHQKTVETVGGWVKNVSMHKLDEVQW